MGASFNPSIVRNGLVCYLDAANPASYTAGQNLLTYSEQIDNAAWSKSNATVSANAAIAPNGTLTADKILEDGTNAEHYLWQGQTASNVTQTFSAYLKAGERTMAYMGFSNFVNASCYVVINLAQGTIVSTTGPNADYTNISGRIDDVGNGWYRCSVTATKGTVNTTNNPNIVPWNGSTSVFASNNTTGYFVWGAQLETNTSMGPYVQTVATNAATRSTTWVNLMGNAAYNGTLNGVVVHNSASSSSTPVLAPASFLTAGTGTSYIDIGNTDLRTAPHSIIAVTRYRGQVANGRIIGSPNNNWLFGTWSGNTDAFHPNNWVHFPTRGFDTNWHIYGTTSSSVTDIWTFWRDGVRLANNNSGTQGPQQIRIGANSSSEPADGHVGVVLIYDRVLSDTEMAQTMAALRGRYGT